MQKGYHSFVAFANINHFCKKSYNFCLSLSKRHIISSSKLIFQIPPISNALPCFGVLEQFNTPNKEETYKNCFIGTIFASF